MNSKIVQLEIAIKEMFAAITGGSDDVATHVSLVDKLSSEVIPDAPPMLRHYLERRSYQKALEFIEGHDETEKANC